MTAREFNFDPYINSCFREDSPDEPIAPSDENRLDPPAPHGAGPIPHGSSK